MTIPLYARVQLLTDRFESEGARRGMLGYVIETHAGDRYEVEFSGANGITVAQVVVTNDEIVPAPESK